MGVVVQMLSAVFLSGLDKLESFLLLRASERCGCMLAAGRMHRRRPGDC